MIRTPLLDPTGRAAEPLHPQFDAVLQKLHQGRFLRQMKPEVLRQVLAQGQLVELSAGDWLMREGDHSNEVYMLIEGSLAVTARDKFILRLQAPGEIVGEMAAIGAAPRSADVQAESACRLVAFEKRAFEVPSGAASAPLFYVMVAHVLTEKLRLTTLQSLLRKDERVALAESARIAIVEPQPDRRRQLLDALRTHWPEAQAECFDSRAQLLTEEPQVDLVIADVWDAPEPARDMPAAQQRIAALQALGAPLLIISHSVAQADFASALLDWGVEEALPLPWQDAEMRRALLRLQESRARRQQLDRVERAADTDELTGLASRRRLDEFLQTLVDAYPDSGKPFSLIVADIDFFKHYNDSHGHQAGDRALQAVARVFREKVRQGDLAARFGGEEFVVVLPHCELQSARKIAEMLRHAVAEHPIAHREQQPGGLLSISVGVASFPAEAADVQALFQRADARLYDAKAKGRNCVVAG